MKHPHALVAAALLLVCACAARSASVDDEIEAGLAELVRASESKQVEQCVEKHAEDALLLPPDGGAVRGLAQIRALFAAPYDGVMRDSVIETQAIGGDDRIAYHAGTYRYTLVTGDGATERSGRFLMVWEKVDDTWKVAVDMWD